MAGDPKDDLDWLYRRSDDATQSATTPDGTRVMSEAELRALQRRGGISPQAPTPEQPVRRQPTGPWSQRVTTPPAGAPAPPRPTPGGLPPPLPPAAPAHTKRRRRHPVRNVFVSLLVLLLVWVAFIIGVPIHAWNATTKVDASPAGARPAQQPGTAILLVGSDSREGLSKAEQKKLGTGSVAGQRTDTMMILYRSPTGSSALVSLPRDLYLPIPGHGSNKLNAAYALGGPELLVKTVEQNTGLRLDGYVEVGFGGFVGVVVAVGGGRKWPEEPEVGRESHTHLKKGCQTLTGTQALGYVRMRKADPLGDIGRAKRQREFMAALAKKVATPSSILNPVRYYQLNTAMAKSVRRGDDTSFGEALQMALASRSGGAGDGKTLVVPIANMNASTAAGPSVLWDETKAKKLFAALARGDVAKAATYGQ